MGILLESAGGGGVMGFSGILVLNLGAGYTGVLCLWSWALIISVLVSLHITVQ